MHACAQKKGADENSTDRDIGEGDLDENVTENAVVEGSNELPEEVRGCAHAHA